MQILLPVIEDIESRLENNMSMISDSFTQMSFQDLTGQRIKRIITLVSQMEERLKNMLIYFGIRLKEKEKNPDISMEELNRVAEEKESEVRGPQRSGQGLDQSDIDDILANL
jgi:chemotaxis protein CheZ